MAATNEIFCSYAHEDRVYIEDFRKHLRQMERDGLINPGYLGHSEIMGHLQSANIILLFVSSDFCMNKTSVF